MKNHTLQEVRNKFRPDEVLYTYADWLPRFIDGKKFIPTIKIFPNDTFVSKSQQINYINFENVKISAVRLMDKTTAS